ncbi:hypothetical protein CEXT_745481 [Caerostris extrusa]|uniref:Uncharacterized protein n=1 Tax=Caerostris extrusa TaxID=172846 RepID=A0AAV4WJ16_CAEEX|nr:hypothetical protein CEXT_745481 [Caerostris extrusa]
MEKEETNISHRRPKTSVLCALQVPAIQYLLRENYSREPWKQCVKVARSRVAKKKGKKKQKKARFSAQGEFQYFELALHGECKQRQRFPSSDSGVFRKEDVEIYASNPQSLISMYFVSHCIIESMLPSIDIGFLRNFTTLYYIYLEVLGPHCVVVLVKLCPTAGIWKIKAN